jgi:NADH-quinone oxidoreductase subunit C
VTDAAPVTRSVEPERWVVEAGSARADGFDYFDWLSAVDDGSGSLAVVLHLWSLARREHLFLRTDVPADGGHLHSLAGLFAGAGWHEREAAEMFGLVFDGAPDTRPLLLPDGFAGHPLRKDFPLSARAVKQWPGQHEPGEHGPAARPPSRRRPATPGLPVGEWPVPAPTETAAPEGRAGATPGETPAPGKTPAPGETP